jgi:hypothetical protein
MKIYGIIVLIETRKLRDMRKEVKKNLGMNIVVYAKKHRLIR